VVYLLDGRHRRVAIRNLALSFGQEYSPAQIRAIARENFRRIGECYCCAIKTASMSWEEVQSRVEFVGPPWIRAHPSGSCPSRVLAIGHFGNFEIYARFADFNPQLECATTYRALHPPALNRLLLAIRGRSGCRYFERRSEVGLLREWLAPENRIIGFLTDQHAGRSGVRTKFFGRECATTSAPAIFALRYKFPLSVAICFRTSLARWRIEFVEDIPSRDDDDQPRSVEAISEDINRALEAAIRRDPANWFWVHNRWKPDKLPPARLSQKESAAIAATDS
jgi:lauroyl/myristoyl acyltransferase